MDGQIGYLVLGILPYTTTVDMTSVPPIIFREPSTNSILSIKLLYNIVFGKQQYDKLATSANPKSYKI